MLGANYSSYYNRQSGLIGYVVMLLLSCHCNHLQVRILFQPPLTGKMMPELIYMFVDSGVAGKVPFLM